MNRKDAHVSLAKAFHGKHDTDFDNMKFVHHSLTDVDVADVDTSTHFAGHDFSTPFYINAMTGGSEKTAQLNHDLGLVAAATGIFIATGSVSAGLKDESVIPSFTTIRKSNPNGVIFANIGAGHGLEYAKRAVDMFEADGLQIHVNTPQEIIMPEGDRVFSNWKHNIEEITHGLHVPVIVKEVGFGMSHETVATLANLGAKTIDVSGTGGTNFAQIENARRDKRELTFLEGWGQSTAIGLLEADFANTDSEILASGGIRNSLDIVKSLAFGAKAVGISGTVLNCLMNDGVEKTIELIKAWQNEICLIMSMLNAKTLDDLAYTNLILSNEIKDWAIARHIDYKKYANR
jgi:isopentenyl-diphosphate delta-isomerase